MTPQGDKPDVPPSASEAQRARLRRQFADDENTDFVLTNLGASGSWYVTLIRREHFIGLTPKDAVDCALTAVADARTWDLFCPACEHTSVDTGDGSCETCGTQTLTVRP